MASRRTVGLRGIRFSAKPAFWLRRFMPGIFVESCNPAFRITLERFEESHDPWPNDEILIFAEFSDRTRREIARFPVPNLEVGEQHSVVIDGVFVPRSGATKLAVSPTGRLRAANFSTFYAYSPLPEETLWYVGLTTLLLLGTLSASVYAALD